MKRFRLVVIVLLFTTTFCGQTHNSADKLFKAEDYVAAQEAYGALLKSYPTNALYLYRYARCAQELGDDATALKYFEKSGNRYVLKHFYAAESHLRLWQTDDAIAEYETYLKKEPDERTKYVQEQIAKAEKLQRYLKRVERLQVIDSVNVLMDSMLCVVTLSAEAGKLTLDANQIVYTNQRNDRRYWGSKHENNTILVSSQRLLDSWSTPDTLPTNINFTNHQHSPYLLNDGVTLYFAAQDTNGLGGMDIYVSRYNTITETYTTPENLGFPYNSAANEYLFVIDEARHIGYLATDRFTEKGRVHIYSFAIPEQKQYWRNIPHESLVEYAQLNKFERFSTDTTINPITDKTTDKIGDFCFVVNDSVVYHSLEEFQQTLAIEKYNEWRQIEQQYQLEQQQLHLLREEYAMTEDDRKKELTPTILRLENNQSQLLKRCQNLLSEIRAIELKAR